MLWNSQIVVDFGGVKDYFFLIVVLGIQGYQYCVCEMFQSFCNLVFDYFRVVWCLYWVDGWRRFFVLFKDLYGVFVFYCVYRDLDVFNLGRELELGLCFGFGFWEVVLVIVSMRGGRVEVSFLYVVLNKFFI